MHRRKSAVHFMLVCSARGITWWWKSTTDLAVGTVSRRQGCLSWGRIWKKPDVEAEKCNHGQNLGLTNRNCISRRIWDGRVSKSKQSPNPRSPQNEFCGVLGYCTKSQGVNTADICGEGCNAYPRRSCRRETVVTTNCKKSADAIVPSREKTWEGLYIKHYHYKWKTWTQRILWYIQSTQVFALNMIEPPCTEPYARWCERTANQLMVSFLLD